MGLRKCFTLWSNINIHLGLITDILSACFRLSVSCCGLHTPSAREWEGSVIYRGGSPASTQPPLHPNSNSRPPLWSLKGISEPRPNVLHWVHALNTGLKHNSICQMWKSIWGVMLGFCSYLQAISLQWQILMDDTTFGSKPCCIVTAYSYHCHFSSLWWGHSTKTPLKWVKPWRASTRRCDVRGI